MINIYIYFYILSLTTFKFKLFEHFTPFYVKLCIPNLEYYEEQKMVLAKSFNISLTL